jgi:hypothetical protein
MRRRKRRRRRPGQGEKSQEGGTTAQGKNVMQCDLELLGIHVYKCVVISSPISATNYTKTWKARMM